MTSPGARPADAGPDPDALADAAAGAPGVVRLSGGVAGEVATYLPGRRVSGVRVRDDRVEVHVVLAPAGDLREVAEGVRSALAPLAGGRPVDVVVADLALPEEQADPEEHADAEPSP